MNPAPAYATLGDLSPAKRIGLFTCIAFMGLLIWDFSGLDLWVVHGLADGSGFYARGNWWLDTVLHLRAKQLAIVIYLALWVMVWWPQSFLRQLSRLQRAEIMVGITVGLITISTLKHFSLTSCPWSLQAFGGPAVYVSHWSWGVADGGPGSCFPGGHVSSALAFVGLSLPWLASGLASQRRIGLRILMVVLLCGLVLGTTQTLRGAHYPSHTFWTGFICWMVALGNHLLFGWLSQRQR